MVDSIGFNSQSIKLSLSTNFRSSRWQSEANLSISSLSIHSPPTSSTNNIAVCQIESTISNFHEMVLDNVMDFHIDSAAVKLVTHVEAINHIGRSASHEGFGS